MRYKKAIKLMFCTLFCVVVGFGAERKKKCEKKKKILLICTPFLAGNSRRGTAKKETNSCRRARKCSPETDNS